MKLCLSAFVFAVLATIAHGADSNAIVNVVQLNTSHISSSDDAQGESTPQKVFKAEKYWKKIQPDEAIPRGLHVRMNLQTGEKEAKLLDESEQTSQDNQPNIPKNELKYILKSVKNEADSLNETDRSKFRDMDTIRKEFDELNLKVAKSDSHTIEELINLYRKGSGDDRKSYLKQMEYLLHQYDVAKDFVKMGGINDLLTALDDPQLRGEAALALGAALQGNPTVQQAAYILDATESLLASLRHGCDSQCVFGLSTLLRQYPKAQQTFASKQGPATLAQVFQRSDSGDKVRIRIITLLSDLLIEKRHALNGREGDELKKAYSAFDLTPHVVEAGFCDLIGNALKSQKEDIREKVLNALHSLVDSCKLDRLVPQLESLRSHYRFLMNEESLSTPDEYFQSLYLLCDDLIKHITDENHVHIEL